MMIRLARTLLLLAVVALCAAALVLGTATPAEAKKNTETVRLVPPDHSPDADATGKIKKWTAES